MIKKILITLVIGLILVGVMIFFYTKQDKVTISYDFVNPYEQFCSDRGHGPYVNEGCVERGEIVYYDLKKTDTHWIIDGVKIPIREKVEVIENE